MDRKLMILGAGLLLVSCTNDNMETPVGPVPNDLEKNSEEVVKAKERVDILLTSEEKLIVDAQNDFAFRFFKEAAALAKGSEKEVLVSPLSVELMVSMFANGVTGEAGEEMVNILMPGCKTNLMK